MIKYVPYSMFMYGVLKNLTKFTELIRSKLANVNNLIVSFKTFNNNFQTSYMITFVKDVVLSFNVQI